MNFNFIEGKGIKSYDTSIQNRVAELKGGVSWIVENGLIFDGNTGYLELPTLDENVYFTNGFKIEFEGTIGNTNNLSKVLDLATIYNNDNTKNKNCSINIGINGGSLIFNTTSLDYKTYKVTENTIDLSQKHKFMLNCVDNGKTGYDGIVQYPFGYGLSYTNFEYEILGLGGYEGPKKKVDCNQIIRRDFSKALKLKGEIDA